MNELEIIKLKESIKHLTKCKVFLDKNELIIIDNIINYKTDILNKIEKENRYILNATKTELGIVQGSLNKHIYFKYKNHINNIVDEYVFKLTNKYKSKKDFNDYYCSDEYDLLTNKDKQMYIDWDSLIFDFKRDIEMYLYECTNKTKLSDEIIYAKIHLSRTSNCYKLKPLEVELNEYIKINMYESFYNQFHNEFMSFINKKRELNSLFSA